MRMKMKGPVQCLLAFCITRGKLSSSDMSFLVMKINDNGLNSKKKSLGVV